MNCHGVAHVLDLYTEGRLSPRRAAQVRAHVDSCAACRALVKPVPAAPAVCAPEEFKRRLAGALRAAAAAADAPAGRDLAMPLWPREAPAILLAAAALVLVAFWITATGVPSQQSGGAPIAAVEER